jgi:TolA-binding protein
VINSVNSAFAEIDIGSRVNGSKIIERLERMERDLVSLQRQFYRDRPSDSEGSNVKSGSNIAEIDARIDHLEEKLRVINGSIEKLQYETNKQNHLLSEIIEKQNTKQISELASKVPEQPVDKKNKINDTKKIKVPKKDPIVKDESKALGKIKIQNINEAKNVELEDDENHVIKEKIVVSDNIDIKDNEDSLKKAAAQDLYDKSFNYLRSSKLENAERGFTTFVSKYKDHPLIGNAYYWLGETYFIRKDY